MKNKIKKNYLHDEIDQREVDEVDSDNLWGDLDLSDNENPLNVSTLRETRKRDKIQWKSIPTRLFV